MTRRSMMTGARALNNTFRQITPGLTVPMNQASRKALAPMLKDAKANVKSNGNIRTGWFRKSLVIRRDPKAPPEFPTHYVGPARRARHRRLGHLLEFGTSPRFEGGRLMHPGQSPSPFLAPSFEANRDRAIKIFGDEIGPAVERRAAKLAAKAAKQ